MAQKYLENIQDRSLQEFELPKLFLFIEIYPRAYEVNPE